MFERRVLELGGPGRRKLSVEGGTAVQGREKSFTRPMWQGLRINFYQGLMGMKLCSLALEVL